VNGTLEFRDACLPEGDVEARLGDGRSGHMRFAISKMGIFSRRGKGLLVALALEE